MSNIIPYIESGGCMYEPTTYKPLRPTGCKYCGCFKFVEYLGEINECTINE